jgi:hypothetical protein
MALCCTDDVVSVEQILRWSIDRWPIEVNVESVRAHLTAGVEIPIDRMSGSLET